MATKDNSFLPFVENISDEVYHQIEKARASPVLLGCIELFIGLIVGREAHTSLLVNVATDIVIRNTCRYPRPSWPCDALMPVMKESSWFLEEPIACSSAPAFLISYTFRTSSWILMASNTWTMQILSKMGLLLPITRKHVTPDRSNTES